MLLPNRLEIGIRQQPLYTTCKWRTTPPVEGEPLAVAWAFDKARHFFLGCNDHRCRHEPHTASQSVDIQEDGGNKKPATVQPEGENTTFPVKDPHVLGKRHFTADIWSRYASGDANHNKINLPDDAHEAMYSPVPTILRWNQERRRPNNEGGLQPRGCRTGRTPDTRCHDNIIIHRIGHLGQRQGTYHRRSTMRHLNDTNTTGFPEDNRSMPELTRIYHHYMSDLSIVERVILSICVNSQERHLHSSRSYGNFSSHTALQNNCRQMAAQNSRLR